MEIERKVSAGRKKIRVFFLFGSKLQWQNFAKSVSTSWVLCCGILLKFEKFEVTGKK